MSSATASTVGHLETGDKDVIVGVSSIQGSRVDVQNTNMMQGHPECSWPPKRSRRKASPYFPTKPITSSLSSDAELIKEIVFEKFSAVSQGKTKGGKVDSQGSKLGSNPKPAVYNECQSKSYMLPIGIAIVLLVAIAYLVATITKIRK